MLSAQRIPVDCGTIHVKRLPLRDFTVSEVRFPPRLYLDSHYHEHGCLTIMCEGGFRERMPGKSLACEAGTILVKPPAERHDDLFGANGSHHVIVEPAYPTLDMVPEFAMLFGGISLTRNAATAMLGDRIRTELALSDGATPLAVEGLVLEIVASLVRAVPENERRPPRWLIRVCERLEETPFAELSLVRLAADAEVHPVYFARQFRRHYGLSVGAYVRRRRLQWTAQQIVTSRAPLAEIAHAAGFADQSHFTREFKRHYGVAPQRYRAAIASRVR